MKARCLHGRLLICISTMLLVLSAGCSSFNREWKRAAVGPAPVGIEGRWDGRWVSDANGHSGRLRCLVLRQSEQNYQARFHATYFGVLRFGYTVLLDAHPTKDGYKFHGDADLGRWAGGTYHYEGEATTNKFFSTYRSQHDHGTFEMTRP